MKNIYEQIVEYLSNHQNGVLATIIWTSGSTPAPAQSKMLVDLEGNRIAGTIGGGCLENTVIQRSIAMQDKQIATILDFELDDDNTEIGLICGGKLKVLLEVINHSQSDVFQVLAKRYNEGLQSIFVTQILSNNATLKTVLDEKFKYQIGAQYNYLVGFNDLFKKYQPIIQNVEEITYIAEPIEGKAPLFVFGGGHVGKAVTSFASQVNFNVTVVDDRIEYANTNLHSDADATFCISFKNINELLNISNSSYVVIATRGHAYDEMILEQVIPLKPKYIGLIGSKHKVLTTFKKLIERGIDKAELHKVYAPVGLEIGAVSVEEIAISIVAEMIHIRRKFNTTNSIKHKKIW